MEFPTGRDLWIQIRWFVVGRTDCVDLALTRSGAVFFQDLGVAEALVGYQMKILESISGLETRVQDLMLDDPKQPKKQKAGRDKSPFA